MKEYITSKLSKGNLLFPRKITLYDNSIMISRDTPISNYEKTIPFNRLATVSINTPVVGFTTITLETNGVGFEVINGFYRSDALEIKKLILNKISNETN